MKASVALVPSGWVLFTVHNSAVTSIRRIYDARYRLPSQGGVDALVGADLLYDAISDMAYGVARVRLNLGRIVAITVERKERANLAELGGDWEGGTWPDREAVRRDS